MNHSPASRAAGTVAKRWSAPIGCNWRVCTLEIDRGGFSYTVDTLRQLHTELPEAELFFLIGADAVRDVPHWKEPTEIFALATPLVVRRAGQPESDLTSLAALCPRRTPAATRRDAGRRYQQHRNPPPRRAGEPIDDLVPPTVADYIATQNLYR